MKKEKKKYEIPEMPLNMVSEPAEAYITRPKAANKNTLIADFGYEDFKSIADKSPFTLSDWADLLYISERTLQRYAKEDGAFNGLQVERILQLKKLVNTGNAIFGKDGFKNWLTYKPFSLGGHTVKDMLVTHEGIQEVIDLMGRMQHGISA